MSSRTPNRSSLAALLLASLAVPAAAPAALPLPVVATVTVGAETTVVVDLSSRPPAAGSTATITHDGATRPADLEPVVADGLAVTLVVDATTEGAATLPAWLSAAARFMLAAPATTQAVIIPDRAPVAVLGPAQRGPFGIVRSLNSVRAGGERDTAAALELAERQFPDVPAGRRVVLLYTTAADAGVTSADRLAARYRAAGTILVVVGPAAAGTYWSAAATGTGGFFAPAGDPVVVPALDQVETTLSGRYLVRFPTPPDLPARVVVSVDTGEPTFTGEVVVAERPGTSSRPGWLWLAAAVAGLALLLGAVVLVARRASGRRAPAIAAAYRPLSVSDLDRPANSDLEGTADRPMKGAFGAGPRSPNPMSPPARGRAVVPGAGVHPDDGSPAN
ncbi:hypothetical protein [Actinoplanes aureus]|uniref:VWFA domain-containing protein n=1 Tax=Actinoplanes aureus TaxID=2792083 RepID=A0A931G0T0_9ACTN|nr:hypothetical protein [Actinoplanes aureus]MBG0567118.1 hypothetical protein [Actinoplanes aureus]